VQTPRQLLIVLGLLIIVGLIFIIIVVIKAGRSMRGTNVKDGQLSRSQRGIGVEYGREDRHTRELMEWLIPLTVNDLLVAADNLHALLYHIQTLIGAAAHGEDTSKHLQGPGVGAGGGGGGITTSGSVSRSHNWRRRRSMMSHWILGNYGMKRPMSK
jgi:hypothetical protein